MSCFCVYERSPLKSIEVGLMHRRRGGTESTPGGSGFTKGRQIIGVKAESESELKRKNIKTSQGLRMLSQGTIYCEDKD